MAKLHFPRHFSAEDHECDLGIDKDLCTHVVLSGNTTMFQGLGVRMPNELTASAPYCTMQIKVVA